MRSFAAGQYGRIVVLHLGKGERVLESLREELARMKIKNGVILSAIGSMRKVSLHVITSTEDLPVNEYITLTDPIEMGAMQGMILDGEPHLHIVCSNPRRAYTGHLEDGCEVQYLAEICIAEIDHLELTRKLDDYGISYITEKNVG